MSFERLTTRFLLGMVVIVLNNTFTYAGVLTYTETVDIDGSLNGVPFSPTMISISGTANTSGIVSPSSFAAGGYRNTFSSPVNFSVAGVGSGSFTDNVDVETASNYAGFLDLTSLNVIFLVNSSDLAGYDLSTPIGPVVPISGSWNPGPAYQTSAGPLVFGSNVVSYDFQAVAVPEPSSLALLGTVGLAFVRRRRRLSSQSGGLEHRVEC
jgi:hypothetical protein